MHMLEKNLSLDNRNQTGQEYYMHTLITADHPPTLTVLLTLMCMYSTHKIDQKLYLVWKEATDSKENQLRADKSWPKERSNAPAQKF